MKYNPQIHNRRSIRLKGYDYSRQGLYYITICVQNRLCLFGDVVNGEMILNDAGQMVEQWYFELENKYPDKKCHDLIVMPNHIHCIVENKPLLNVDVMDNNVLDDTVLDAHVGTSLRGRPNNERGRPNDEPPEHSQQQYGIDNKKYNATIGDAMDWFKTMVTNGYIRGVKQFNWTRFDKKLLQRNYWEHIIRNDTEYARIADYINDNPKKWDNDKLNSNK